MSVNMTELWSLITEITTNTDTILNLIFLGVIIAVTYAIKWQIMDFLKFMKDPNKYD